jgi:monoamine oxidase
MANEHVEVVVVGAGFVGLTAARALDEAGRSVVVFEARDRVGGRTCTEEHHGTWIDLGGQWIGPGQERIAALIAELGFGTYPQPEQGDDLLLDDGVAHRVPNVALAFTDEELVAYLELVGALEAIAEQVPLDAPWRAPEAAAWDATSLRDWVRARGVGPRVAGLFEVGVQALFAASTAQLSLLHAAHYVHSAGGWSKLTDTEGGAQQDRVEGGVQAVAERLAGLLPEGALRLSSPVGRIARDDHSVVVEAADTVVRADRAVVALPPTLAGRIGYDPPLPAQRDQLVQHMSQGSVIKVPRALRHAVVARRGPVGDGPVPRRAHRRDLRLHAAGRHAGAHHRLLRGPGGRRGRHVDDRRAARRGRGRARPRSRQARPRSPRLRRS